MSTVFRLCVYSLLSVCVQFAICMSTVCHLYEYSLPSACVQFATCMCTVYHLYVYSLPPVCVQIAICMCTVKIMGTRKCYILWYIQQFVYKYVHLISWVQKALHFWYFLTSVHCKPSAAQLRSWVQRVLHFVILAAICPHVQLRSWVQKVLYFVTLPAICTVQLRSWVQTVLHFVILAAICLHAQLRSWVLKVLHFVTKCYILWQSVTFCNIANQPLSRCWDQQMNQWSVHHHCYTDEDCRRTANLPPTPRWQYCNLTTLLYGRPSTPYKKQEQQTLKWLTFKCKMDKIMLVMSHKAYCNCAWSFNVCKNHATFKLWWTRI